MKTARKLWLNSLTATYGEMCTFKRINDILDFAEYLLSGDLIRKNTESICGNITMFDM